METQVIALDLARSPDLTGLELEGGGKVTRLWQARGAWAIGIEILKWRSTTHPPHEDCVTSGAPDMRVARDRSSYSPRRRKTCWRVGRMDRRPGLRGAPDAPLGRVGLWRRY